MKKSLLPFNTDNRLLFGYVISFLLLLVSCLITLYSNKKLLEETQMVSHTHKVISNLESLLSSVKDAETGLRGFINSNDSIYLEPYFKSVAQKDKVFLTVETEIVDNKVQMEQLVQLKALIDSKYKILNFVKTYYINNNFKIDKLLFGLGYKGKATMDSITRLVTNMQKHEEGLLTKRSKNAANSYTSLNIIVIISLVLAFALCIFGTVTFQKENRARHNSDKTATNSQAQLKERIEELRKANIELVEMRREEKFAATGRIARTIAHEVRNPLTNIDLAVAQIKEEVDVSKDDIALLFDMINRNSNRINQLITELLNATRFSDLSTRNISINELLKDALALAKDRMVLNNVQLNLDFSTDICDINVDSDKIKIAFLNIIINGIEAMEKNNQPGILTILTKGENGKCVVEISDNGTGMDEKELLNLFEAYYTTKPKGNGLGLTNTQNIILNHQGTIRVESEKNIGTRFIIAFDFA